MAMVLKATCEKHIGLSLQTVHLLLDLILKDAKSICPVCLFPCWHHAIAPAVSQQCRTTHVLTQPVSALLAPCHERWIHASQHRVKARGIGNIIGACMCHCWEQVSAAGAQVWHDTDGLAWRASTWSVASSTGQTTTAMHRRSSLYCYWPARG